MKISKTEIEKICKIAKISIPENQEKALKFCNHIQLILNWISEIQSIETTGINPMVNPLHNNSDFININTIQKSENHSNQIKKSAKIINIDDEIYFQAPLKVL
jgi:aspartyl/glutamyl-tRNA(Asn/Gln) amidotransferase C subunit